MKNYFIKVLVVYCFGHSDSNVNAAGCQTTSGPDGTCYWLTDATFSRQTNAVRACEEDGGVLASIKTHEVASFLLTELPITTARYGRT